MFDCENFTLGGAKEGLNIDVTSNAAIFFHILYGCRDIFLYDCVLVYAEIFADI